jgi:hypothetical protein
MRAFIFCIRIKPRFGIRNAQTIKYLYISLFAKGSQQILNRGNPK